MDILHKSYIAESLTTDHVPTPALEVILFKEQNDLFSNSESPFIHLLIFYSYLITFFLFNLWYYPNLAVI
jgi:hypothetical protein